MGSSIRHGKAGTRSNGCLKKCKAAGIKLSRLESCKRLPEKEERRKRCHKEFREYPSCINGEHFERSESKEQRKETPKENGCKEWYVMSDKVKNKYAAIVQGLFLFSWVVGVGGRVHIRKSLKVPVAGWLHHCWEEVVQLHLDVRELQAYMACLHCHEGSEIDHGWGYHLQEDVRSAAMLDGRMHIRDQKVELFFSCHQKPSFMGMPNLLYPPSW